MPAAASDKWSMWWWLAAGATLVAVFLLFVGGTVPHDDFNVFFAAGKAVLHGRDPYPPVDSAAVRAGHAFAYPLFVAWVFAPLSLLPRAAAFALFTGLGTGAVLWAGATVAPRQPHTFALLAASTFAITDYQVGALNALLLAGLVAGWRFRQSPLLLAGILAPVVAAKLFLLPVLAWPLLTGRRRAGVIALLAAASLIGAGLLFGPIGTAHYTALLHALSRREAAHGIALVPALARLGIGLVPGEAVAATVSAAVALIACRQREHNEIAVFAAMIGASLLMSPIVWSHYLLLLAAPILCSQQASQWMFALAFASWAVTTPHGANAVGVSLGVGIVSFWAFATWRISRRATLLAP